MEKNFCNVLFTSFVAGAAIGVVEAVAIPATMLAIPAHAVVGAVKGIAQGTVEGFENWVYVNTQIQSAIGGKIVKGMIKEEHTKKVLTKMYKVETKKEWKENRF